MKKTCKYLFLLFTLFFLGITGVNAERVKSASIPEDTYVIGTHLFNRDTNSVYKGSLNTKVVMLAAKTIKENTLDKMIIYYKNIDGEWVDGLTGNTIETPSEFEIDYVNTELVKNEGEQLNTPKITYEWHGEEYDEDLEWTWSLYELKLNNSFGSYDGIEVYIALEEDQFVLYHDYSAEELYEVEVLIGNKYYTKIRTYIESDGERKYSDYSNEIVLFGPVIKTPEISIAKDEKEEQSYLLNSSIVYDGIEIYYIEDGVYKLKYDYKASEKFNITIPVGESYSVVARTYLETPMGTKYSDYSDIVTVHNLKLKTPELFNQTLTACGTGIACPDFVPVLTDGVYRYDLGINKIIYSHNTGFEYDVTGYAIYEKTESGYIQLGIHEMIGSEIVEVTIEPGQKKTYVARVYKETSQGEKIYSDYSNEVVIDHTKLRTPELFNLSLTECGTGSECSNFIPTLIDGVYFYDLGIDKSIYRGISEIEYEVTGYVIYEKINNRYEQIASYEMIGSDMVEVLIEPGEKKTYVAKVYAENTQGDKIYSDYSNEVVIDHSKLNNPTLTNSSGIIVNGSIENTFDIITEGLYADGELLNTISGYELYEKDGETYTLVATKKTTEESLKIHVSVDIGEKKTYVARVFKFINTSNEKVYSGYSNEVVVDNLLLETPTLTNSSGIIVNGSMENTFDIISEGLYAEPLLLNTITGYELYEKDGETYTLIATKKTTEESLKIHVSVDIGEKKTYVARVFKFINTSNEKVYSGYSNEVVVDNLLLETPTLTNVFGGTATTEYVYYGQYEQPWASELHGCGSGDSFQAKGCFQTSMAMIATNLLGRRITPSDMNALTKNNIQGSCYIGSDYHGSYATFFDVAAEEYGLVRETIANKQTNSAQRMKEELAKGNLIIQLLTCDHVSAICPTAFGGHAVVIVPGSKEGYVRVLDPGRSQKTWEVTLSEAVGDNTQGWFSSFSVKDGTVVNNAIINNFNIITEGLYAEPLLLNTITGYELYEKNGETYTLVATRKTTDNPFDVEITTEPGEKKTYVARVFKYVNTSNEKVYSDYSNEIVINN